MDIDEVNDLMQTAHEIGEEDLLHELAGDLVDEVRRLQKTRGWIPVTEALPKDDSWQWVMVKGGDYPERGAYHSKEGAWYIWSFGWVGSVIHWMSLPEPPKEST